MSSSDMRIHVLQQHLSAFRLNEPAIMAQECFSSTPACAPRGHYPLFARPAQEEDHPLRKLVNVFPAQARGPGYMPTKPGTYATYFDRAAAKPMFARPCNKAAAERDQLRTGQTGVPSQPRLVETASAYQLEVDMPTVSANSLRVEVQGNKLVVTGRQSVPDGRMLFNRGMPRGVFRTMHRLPVGADPHSLLASFTNGVLRIDMRKQA